MRKIASITSIALFLVIASYTSAMGALLAQGYQNTLFLDDSGQLWVSIPGLGGCPAGWMQGDSFSGVVDLVVLRISNTRLVFAIHGDGSYQQIEDDNGWGLSILPGPPMTGSVECSWIVQQGDGDWLIVITSTGEMWKKGLHNTQDPWAPCTLPPGTLPGKDKTWGEVKNDYRP